jgi:hypothetical protein
MARLTAITHKKALDEEGPELDFVFILVPMQTCAAARLRKFFGVTDGARTHDNRNHNLAFHK